MRINTNIGALTAANSLTKTNDAVRASADKLSSGFRINKASDDAAGLGVANIFRADIRALTQAQRNAEQAQSVFSIAESGVGAIGKILERMKELAAQSASDSVDSNGRTAINTEFVKLRDEIDRISGTTEFQGQSLLNGGFGAIVANTNSTDITGYSQKGKTGTYAFAGDTASVTATFTDGVSGLTTVQIANTAANLPTVSFDSLGLTLNLSAAAALDTTLINTDTLIVTAPAVMGSFMIGAARSGGYTSTAFDVLQVQNSDFKTTATTLGVIASDVSSLSSSQTALASLDTAITAVNLTLGKIGAGANRLSTAIDSIKSTILNYQSAESTIRDLDMATEMVAFSKNQILAQAATAMLAQANQSGQGILKLLQ